MFGAFGAANIALPLKTTNPLLAHPHNPTVFGCAFYHLCAFWKMMSPLTNGLKHACCSMPQRAKFFLGTAGACLVPRLPHPGGGVRASALRACEPGFRAHEPSNCFTLFPKTLSSMLKLHQCSDGHRSVWRAYPSPSFPVSKRPRDVQTVNHLTSRNSEAPRRQHPRRK